jgi:bifunctional non-homologous end joining protein LigD
VDGTLKSWAVPKGPSLRPGEKRLAVEVEDHPLDYADFAGDIPEGHYGAGHVDIFDRGTWSPVGDPAAAIRKGKLEFELHGGQLRGGWKLVRTQLKGGGKPQWLLLKRDDDAARDAEADDLMPEALQRATRQDEQRRAARKRKPAVAAAPKAGKSLASEQAASATRATRTAKKPPARRKGKAVDWATRASELPGAARLRRGEVVEPQLALAAKAPPAGKDWLHEVKWDGYRMLGQLRGGRARMRSRNDLDWTDRLPAQVASLEGLPVADADLDGELVALDDKGLSDFGRLQQALKGAGRADLVYVVFDLPTLAGVDLRDVPLAERKALLRELLEAAADPRLFYSSHGVGNGGEAFAASLDAGMEGIVSKRVDAPYVGARNGDWLKLRHQAGEDYIVVGYTAPSGARTGFGALLLARESGDGALEYVGRVGSGYSEAVLRSLHAQLRGLRQQAPTVSLPPHTPLRDRDVTWVRPELVVEVAFRGWGREGLLRQASFLRVRDDKRHVARGRRAAAARAGAGSSRTAKRAKSATGKAAKKGNGAAGTGSTSAAKTSKARKSRRAGEATGGNVRISSPERVVYAGKSITKGEVADYYRAIAPWMLPWVAGRPLSLLRCPDGAGGECFFQKNHSGALGDSVDRVALSKKRGEAAGYIAIHDADGLLELVQMNALEFHPWGSTVDDLEHPDTLVFDLDPGPGLGWKDIVAAARDLRGRLGEVGLESFARLSGGKGLHVVVPIAPVHDWDTAKGFCEAVARTMATIDPKRYVASASKELRKGRIFIDWLRNGRGATSVANWSLRARPGAGVATPIRWEELGRAKSGDHYDLAGALRRVARLKGDPWEGWERASRQELTMKLGSLKEGGRDGTLIVVSRDLARAVRPPASRRRCSARWRTGRTWRRGSTPCSRRWKTAAPTAPSTWTSPGWPRRCRAPTSSSTAAPTCRTSSACAARAAPRSPRASTPIR